MYNEDTASYMAINERMSLSVYKITWRKAWSFARRDLNALTTSLSEGAIAMSVMLASEVTGLIEMVSLQQQSESGFAAIHEWYLTPS
jgi:hypothetical protein